jgi:DNA-directed RNA polymerase specialized sigma24 family protein
MNTSNVKGHERCTLDKWIYSRQSLAMSRRCSKDRPYRPFPSHQLKDRPNWSMTELRLAEGLTQHALGERLGLDTSIINALETQSRSNHSIAMGTTSKTCWRQTALKVANYFGVSPEELWPEQVPALEDPCVSEYTATPTDPETLVSQKEQLEQVTLALDDLLPRSRISVVLRYGLDGGGKRTFDEVGYELGVSPERARQIVASAVSKLVMRLNDISYCLWLQDQGPVKGHSTVLTLNVKG